ncbi:hypothetical protein [Pseudomonas sp. NPDC007930]|uniref:hypothetical protein n=1 Tax=Pseudomonas sp. NPDC007930 TaxID=3364417 RepID=UPI0036E75803
MQPIYTQMAYNLMLQMFLELKPFERHRSGLLSDEQFRGLQEMLLERPYSGDVIAGTGGLRKVRYADPHRGKGKRSRMTFAMSNVQG